jgi:hypothetical protein
VLKKLLYGLPLTFAALLTLEAGLRLLPLLKTYSEKTQGIYVNPYMPVKQSWLWTGTPSDTFSYTQPEFSFTNFTNRLGIREQNLSKADTCIRYLFLGDSFTEGDGVPYQYSMPRVFENLIADSCGKVYNAGVCGSDVWYNYMLYKQALDSFKFKQVFLVINAGEIKDLYVRGGVERFSNNGAISWRKRPIHNVLYQYSFLYRLGSGLLGYDELGMNIRWPLSTYKYQLAEIGTAVDSLNTLCRERNAQLIVVAHPFPLAFSDPDFKVHIPPYETVIPPQVPFINLEVPLYNSFQALPIDSFAWPVNGHFKQHGYKVFAAQLYQQWKQLN